MQNTYAMHTIKITSCISVQTANLSDCQIESNQKIDSVARIKSNGIETFLPELECSSHESLAGFGSSVEV